MYKFFTDRRFQLWSILGTMLIIGGLVAQTFIDVAINDWFGVFYNDMQKALAEPGSVSESQLLAHTFEFAWLAAIYVVIATLILGFFTNHWTFRWRKSMAELYHENWEKARNIEGASQRVQEDTLKFARIVENLGIGLLEAIFTLIAFVPILWGLSKMFSTIPFVGEVPHALVVVVLTTALIGTVGLGWVGRKLPGIEYDIQKEEAAYRKELVKAEDEEREFSFDNLFDDVRKIHFKSYWYYMQFNVAKWSYLQGMVIVPYVVMSPTIAAGTITLGAVSQTGRAFGKVAESLQYVIRSWTLIVELVSVHKRLREFEKQIKETV